MIEAIHKEGISVEKISAVSGLNEDAKKIIQEKRKSGD